MKASEIFLYVVLCAMLIRQSAAQPSQGQGLLHPSPALNKPRVYAITGSWFAIYSVALIGLNELWYKNYPRSRFHFFNDAAEWQQVDKAGHAFTAYFESRWSMAALRWAGVSEKKSIWIGGMVGPLFQTTIEILDGYSEKWGASFFDLAANEAGAAIAISQQLAWHDQRIILKFSTHTEEYDASVQNRVDELYGTGFWATVMKDYNGQDYWLSVNLHSFMRAETKFPQWLNIALGYGAGGMLGGFKNQWKEFCVACVPEPWTDIDRSDIIRYRKFLISPDVDLTRIQTGSRFLQFIFGLANIVKVPVPAMEFNTKGEIVFHPVYFLNWSRPLFLSR